MIYQNDPNTNRRSDKRDDARYTGWIIGGVVALAIVIAVFAFTSTGNRVHRLIVWPEPLQLAWWNIGMRTIEDNAFLLLIIAVSLAFAWILLPFYGAALWRRRLLKSMRQPRNLAAKAE